MALHIQKFMITPLIFFLRDASPKTWKQTFPSGAHELDGLKIIFTDLNIMIWKWQYYLKKKPASLILVIQFTYKGWINNSKKLWSYFNETKAEKKVHALKLNFKHFYHFKIDINPIEHAIIAFKSLKRLNWRVISRIRCGVGTARLAWPCCDVSHDSADSSWARLALPCHGRGRNTAE